MRLSAGQTGTELTFFAWLRTTSRAANREGLFFFDFHAYIVKRGLAARWSIVTTLLNIVQFE
jgi:hypothetical protein